MVDENSTNGGSIAITTKNPSDGLEEKLTVQRRTHGERKFTVVTDNLGVGYLVCGSVKPEDVAEIVFTREHFSTAFGGSTATELRIEALEFDKDEKDTQYEASSVSFNHSPGERLLLARLNDKVLPTRVMPQSIGKDNYRLTYLKDILQEFSDRKETATFRMDLVGEEQKRVFVYDPIGRYEMRICKLENRNDFILVNKEDPTEVYLTRGAGFSKISHPTKKILKKEHGSGQVAELPNLSLVDFNTAYTRIIGAPTDKKKGK